MEHNNAAAPTEDIEAQLSGHELYGERLSADQIRSWNEQTELVHRTLLARQKPGGGYEHGTLDRFHVVGLLLQRHFECCLALGCANGDDVAALAPVVDRFVAIEPVDAYWRSTIGTKSVEYLRPANRGDIALADSSVDLATAFDVLHHIPNVSHVLSEVARVLRSDGLFVIREPISWMGDWRRPRAGLTANERGLPLAWFERTALACGFTILRRRLCMFRPLSLVLRRCGVAQPLAHRPTVMLDWLFSELLRWNIQYRRQGVLQKLAPSSALWLLRRAAR